jgi:hypothetical protein
MTVAIAFLAAQAPAAPVLVGVWDFPAIQFDAPSGAQIEPVRAEPLASAPVIARLDNKGVVLADTATYSCRWDRDLNRPTMVRGCLLTESGYEILAVGVFETRGDWLRIALDDNGRRFGWIQPSGEFHALPDLLASDHLTYLTDQWNRLMYDSPGSRRAREARSASRAPSANPEIPYRTIGHTFVGERLWLHVELLDQVCRAEEPRVLDSGWVPAQSPIGSQWAWFWSRGC